MNSKKLLVVVDMQRDFVDGALGFEAARPVVLAVVNEIEQAKNEGHPIVVTYDTHAENYLDSREGKVLPVSHCIENTEGWQLDPAIEEALLGVDYLALKKASFGLSAESVLSIKKHYGESLSEITVCGLVSNMCVLSNVVILQANFPEATLVVPAIATDSFDPSLNAAALQVMKGLQAVVKEV